MAVMLYQGHGSARFTTGAGSVVYLDPFAGKGYDVPADLIIVTHEHGDHNQIQLVPQKKNCVILRAADLLKNGEYQTKTAGDITIRAVPACNVNHPVDRCVGVLLTFDGLTIYCSGDTSEIEAMHTLIPAAHPDYALLPIDGVYNMGPEEASRCADAIGAKHSIPVHSSPSVPGKPGLLFDSAAAERFTASTRLIVLPGETITL